MRRGIDDGLRRRALDALGPSAPPAARLALEAGTLQLLEVVTTWVGSHGSVSGWKAELSMPKDLFAEFEASLANKEVLTAAVAAAVAETRGNALSELQIAADPTQAPLLPYRSPAR